MQELIQHYGYLVILIGAIVEGEAILLMGGLAAHAGYLALPWVIVVAFFGTLFADQAYFFLGRRHSHRLFSWRPSWRIRAEKAEELFRKFKTPLILVFRFLYGIRTMLLFVIGMSPISSKKFVVLNALGAMIWAVLVGTGGYLFGSAFEMVLGKVKLCELSFFGALLIAVSAMWAFRFLRKKRNRA